MKKHALSVAILAGLMLSGCGGSGGTKPSTPPAVDPPPPPPPTTCTDSNATNNGGPLPCVYRYTGVNSNHLVPTNVDRVHAAGITGAGVKVGVLDSGADTSIPSLAGAVAWSNNYRTDVNTSVPDAYGHGSMVAQVIAGRPVSGQGYPGGVAPGASLYVARVCNDTGSCGPSTTLKQAIQDMLAMGVRIFNNSYGGGPFDPAANYSFLYTTYSDLVAANALGVFGTGNNGSAQATPEATLPHLLPTYARNWLAVANVMIDAQGNPTTLDPTSNACGLAAQWCVVAPGRGPIIPVNSNFGIANMTSASTGVVTGVAALVSQAFPWMGGDLLQLSILTTATDLGVTGVDATYGWGMINAERAVRGPGSFAFGNVTANVNQAGSWTWSNDIGGSGGLFKTGIGRLLLSGNNSYSGATSVSGGTLALSGTLRSNVTAQSGGTFESQRGTIHGTYTAQSGSTTAIALGGPLTVNGNAALGGTLRILPAMQGYVVGGTETLLTANAITGTFSATTFASDVFYTGTAAYSPTAVTMTVTRTAATSVAKSAGNPTGAAYNGASHLDGALGLADHWAITGTGNQYFLADAAKVLNSVTQEQAIAGLTEISGEIHGTARNALLATSGQLARTLGNRVDDLSRYDDSGAWFSVQVANGDLDQSGYTSANTSGQNVLAGIDTTIGAATLGAVIGAGEARIGLEDGFGHFDANRTLAGAYGRVAMGEWYASGVLTREWLDVEINRSITGDAVRGERDDRVDQGRVEFGKSGTVTPYIAYRHANYRMGSFTEIGSALALTADGDSHTARYGEVGARFTHNFDWAAGSSTFTGSARYQRLIGGGHTDFAAAFAGSPTLGFMAEGQQLRRDTGLLGASLATSISDGWVWFADAEIEVGGGDVTGSRLSVGLRGSF